MTIPSESWPSVRSAIRELFPLPVDEPVDTIMTAAFLYHHVASRQTNIWLALLSPQSDGSLVTLLDGHPSSHRLPDKIATAYFMSPHTIQQRANAGALLQIDATGQRVLIQPDMSGIVDGLPPGYAGDIYSQLVAVHDGYFKTGAGGRHATRVWGPKKPNETLGFIGAGTERVYGWQSRSHGIGPRLLIYYMPPAQTGWSDTEDLDVMRRATGQTEYREFARRALWGFIDNAIANIEGFDQVTISDDQKRGILSAARLVARVTGPTKAHPSGTRRAIQICELVRMIAFMQGRESVTQNDYEIGVKIALSQMEPLQRNAITMAFANDPGQTFKMSQLCAATGASRLVYTTLLQGLVDMDVLTAIGGRGRGKKYGTTHDAWNYKFSKEASRLVERIRHRSVETDDSANVSHEELDFDRMVEEMKEA